MDAEDKNIHRKMDAEDKNPCMCRLNTRFKRKQEWRERQAARVTQMRMVTMTKTHHVNQGRDDSRLVMVVT